MQEDDKRTLMSQLEDDSSGARSQTQHGEREKRRNGGIVRSERKNVTENRRVQKRLSKECIREHDFVLSPDSGSALFFFLLQLALFGLQNGRYLPK